MSEMSTVCDYDRYDINREIGLSHVNCLMGEAELSSSWCHWPGM